MEHIWEAYAPLLPQINITAHRTHDAFVLYNVQDSLLPAELGFLTILPGQQVLDLGTGGGFPGVPLATMYPEASFVLVDGVQKKLTQIETVVQRLHLTNVKTHHARIEDIGRSSQYREQADVVVSKALAKWYTLLEYTLPLVRVGGVLYAYQGPSIHDELQESLPTISFLGGGVPVVHDYHLTADIARTLVCIPKVKPTPSMFPRKSPLPKEVPFHV